MARIKRMIEVEFDDSNQQFYVFVPVIHSYNPRDDDPRQATVWHTTFASLGAAQAFFIPQADKGINHGEWVMENKKWTLYLQPAVGGYCVVLEETLLLQR